MIEKLDLLSTDITRTDQIAEKRLFVLWLLGNTCTYKCSYCPDLFHDGSFPYHPTDVIQRAIETLPPAHITFSGGEATFHPDFEKIVSEKPDRIEVSVISNASRPIVFWERITQHLRMVILTYHTEFAIFQRFVDTANLIYKTHNKFGWINLTMIPDKWNECVEVYEKLRQENLRVLPKPLVENFGKLSSGVLSVYTKEQLDWIASKNVSDKKKYISVFNNKNEVIYQTNPSELLSIGQTNFKGWLCYTNTQNLVIDLDGEVYDTSCKQRNFLGTIFDGFTVPTEPMLCKQDFCWCHSDIIPAKVKVSS